MSDLFRVFNAETGKYCWMSVGNMHMPQMAKALKVERCGDCRFNYNDSECDHPKFRNAPVEKRILPQISMTNLLDHYPCWCPLDDWIDR